jgi:hypothetical protein
VNPFEKGVVQVAPLGQSEMWISFIRMMEPPTISNSRYIYCTKAFKKSNKKNKSKNLLIARP